MGIRAVGIFAIVSLTERHPIVFIKLRVLRLCGANAIIAHMVVRNWTIHYVVVFIK